MGCVSKAVTLHEVTVIMAYDVHHWAAHGRALGTVNCVTPSRKVSMHSESLGHLLMERLSDRQCKSQPLVPTRICWTFLVPALFDFRGRPEHTHHDLLCWSLTIVQEDVQAERHLQRQDKSDTGLDPKGKSGNGFTMLYLGYCPRTLHLCHRNGVPCSAARSEVQ